jgi:hypothetical protein
MLTWPIQYSSWAKALGWRWRCGLCPNRVPYERACYSGGQRRMRIVLGGSIARWRHGLDKCAASMHSPIANIGHKARLDITQSVCSGAWSSLLTPPIHCRLSHTYTHAPMGCCIALDLFIVYLVCRGRYGFVYNCMQTFLLRLGPVRYH